MINYDETIIEQKQFDNGLDASETVLDPGNAMSGYPNNNTGINASETVLDPGNAMSGYPNNNTGIDASETVLDPGNDMSSYLNNTGVNASETVLDSGNAMSGYLDNNGGTASMASGITIGEGTALGDFKVVRKLSEGAQAKVFIAEKAGGKYVAKAYGRNWQPAKALRVFFSESHQDNVMRVIESGRELGMYYEIYPYYENGNLEDYIQKNGTLSTDFIRKYVVPSVNEGLHHLHSNNVVHCDIKPANLYLEREGEGWRVVIGDLGSCRMMDSDGLVRSSLEGTVNYSVPVEEFYGVKTFPKEYDYASLGLTIYRLYEGKHLMENLSLDERARMWNRELAIPVDDIRIKNLLSGLINKDFGSIWGYDELRRWSDSGWNSDRKRRTSRRQEREASPLIFGTINGEMLRVKTIHELVEACKAHWELAATVIRRFDTLQFIRRLEPQLYQSVDAELKGRTRNENIVLFRVLYLLEKTNRICYKGEDFGTLEDYLKRLLRGEEDAIEFVTFDLLTYYLEIMGAAEEDVDRLDELVKLNRLNALGTRGMIDGICRAFADDQSLNLDGHDIESMNDFVDCIADKTAHEINELLKQEDVHAWLISMGFSKEAEVLRTLVG